MSLILRNAENVKIIYRRSRTVCCSVAVLQFSRRRTSKPQKKSETTKFSVELSTNFWRFISRVQRRPAKTDFRCSVATLQFKNKGGKPS